MKSQHSAAHVITEDRRTRFRHRIRPCDISTEEVLSGAFGDESTEKFAYWIVGFCQQSDLWQPFTREEFGAYGQRYGLKEFSFCRLISKGLIVRGEDGRYCVTHKFISRAFAASPSEKLFAELAHA